MKIFAISDLHLSSAVEKPMNIFGANWDNHFEKICADWESKVSKNDLVLLGGDMSWGMTMDEAAPDYALVSALNGRKIVGKGNHDLYWSSLSKMQKRFPEFDFLQNNAFRIESENGAAAIIAGSRGWTIPEEVGSDDEKIYKRELIRLELSLKQAEKLKKDGDFIIAMLHYPPFNADFNDTEVTALLEKFGVKFCLYGHLHGKGVRIKPHLIKNDVHYILTSCDLIDCKLVEVCEI